MTSLGELPENRQKAPESRKEAMESAREPQESDGKYIDKRYIRRTYKGPKASI